MDLIYTNSHREDIGVLHDFIFDLAFGADENDFELTIDSSNHCCDANSLVYMEGTEYGGIVDGIEVVTKDDRLTYTGRTWHGVLASKILEPDAGANYLVLSGEANAVIGTLISRVGLSDLFRASSENSGLTISNYSMRRYIDAYAGITKMLASVSGKLSFSYKDGHVVLSAAPIVDYTKDEQFDNDQVEMDVKKTFNPVNHMICLGKGELADRQVVHLYMNSAGNISETQTFFGLNEVTDVYENTNAESLDELKKGGREKLQESGSTDSVGMNFDAESTVYDIGDIVGARETITGVTVSEKITKKIVKIQGGEIDIEYKVGE